MSNKPKSKFKQTEIRMIPENWEELKLSEAIEINPKRELKKGVSAKKVPMDCLNPFNKKIQSFEVSKFSGGSKFINKDTLMARITPCLENGKTAFVDILREDEVGFGSTEFIVLSSKNEKTTNDFVYYLSISPQLRKEAIKSMTGTSGRQRVQNDLFDGVEVIIPPINEQSAIAKILSDLDSKIELNQQMNKTLETIGQAIFKQWFVDFKFPNEKGKPYKSSGGEMVDSELGEIPKGWKAGKLGEIGTFKNGINYLRDEKGDTAFFIANVRDIANNKLLLRESLDKINIDLKKAKDYLLNDKDILIARSASPGEVSLVLGDLDKVIYSGFSIRYRLITPSNYLYVFLVLQKLKENLSNFSIGTTLQSVNQDTLRNMRFILPSDKILKEFNTIIE